MIGSCASMPCSVYPVASGSAAVTIERIRHSLMQGVLMRVVATADSPLCFTQYLYGVYDGDQTWHHGVVTPAS